MDIHLPKPMHGWRAFIGEVGIIVLGVLIALGFGQLAETIHENAIAGEARDAVRAEVRENLWWLEYRGLREPCIRKRLAELDDILARARRGEATPLVHYIGVLPHAKITTLRWEANAQAGRASLFSGDEQRSLGNMYYTTQQFFQSQSQEEVTWSKMRFIQGLQQFTPADVHDFSVLLAEAHYQNWEALLSSWRAHQWADRLHLAAENPAWGNKSDNVMVSKYKPQICEPLTAPLVPSPDYLGPDAFIEAGDMP
jgi:hypothetical protein